MAALPIRKFGGILPALEARALPNDGAQTAQDLDMRQGDFRPIDGTGTAVSGVNTTGIATVFRTPVSGTWLTSTTDADFVSDPINNSSYERVFMTKRNGAAYPEAWQADAPTTFRRLGVPAPTAAPTFVVTKVDEFTSDELVTARTKLPEQLKTAYKAARGEVLLGNTPGAPSYPTPGWLQHGSTAGLPTASSTQWAFCVPMVASGGGYSMVHADQHNFLMSTTLGGKRITYSGNQWWAVPVTFQGRGVSINSTTLGTGVAAILNPGPVISTIVYPTLLQLQTDLPVGDSYAYYQVAGSPVQLYRYSGSAYILVGTGTTTPLWTPTEVTTIVSNVTVHYDTTVDPIKGLVEAINAAQINLGTVYDTATSLALQLQAMHDFFASTPIVAELAGLRGDPTGDSSVALAGAFTQEVAGCAYDLGHFDSKGAEHNVPNTVSSYFHDTYVTSVAAAIRYDYDSCLTADSRGVVGYDRAKLGNLISTQFAALGAAHTTGTQRTKDTVDSKVSQCLAILDRVLNETHWKLNPAFPTFKDIDATNAANALTAATDLKAACDALAAYYQQVEDDGNNYIDQVIFDQDILPHLSKPVNQIVESRCYIYTYVTDWGEESAPSLPSAILDCDQNDICTITAPSAPPTGYNIKKIRLYRSSTSAAGSAFQFVVDTPDPGHGDGTWGPYLSYVDAVRQEDLQEVCPSLTWTPPPDNLQGLTSMPNGILLGFYDYTLCACVPFQPFAWPIEYRQTTDTKIVGIGVVGNTAVVLTEGAPYYASGADSSSISLQRMESNQACVSKRSISSGDGGVFYAGPDGLCLAGPSGVTIITDGAYQRDEWIALAPTASIGRFFNGTHYLFLAGGGCLSTDIGSRRISKLSITSNCAYSDLLTDTIYVASGASLLPLFRGSHTAAVWKSKVFVFSQFPGFTWLRVESTFQTGVVVKLYGDGVLRYTSPSLTTRDPVRLPAGRYREFEVQVESAARITAVILATNVEDLVQA